MRHYVSSGTLEVLRECAERAGARVVDHDGYSHLHSEVVLEARTLSELVRFVVDVVHTIQALPGDEAERLSAFVEHLQTAPTLLENVGHAQVYHWPYTVKVGVPT
jgi:hypothetical protein